MTASWRQKCRSLEALRLVTIYGYGRNLLEESQREPGAAALDICPAILLVAASPRPPE